MLLRAQKAMSPLQKERAYIGFVAEKEAHEDGFEVIHNVDCEADEVAAIAKLSHIETYFQLSGDTTVSGAQKLMQKANIVHLACHGVQASGNALQSGFCLGDGRLTISKLMDLKLDHAFLAFLSACETAKGDKNQPDQVMHLAAAMLFTGYKAVVATMW
jgi:CHAT domain-containing protein